jgi:hypothetical protein
MRFGQDIKGDLKIVDSITRIQRLGFSDFIYDLDGQKSEIKSPL